MFAVPVSFRLLNIRSQLHGPASCACGAATVPKGIPASQSPMLPNQADVPSRSNLKETLSRLS